MSRSGLPESLHRQRGAALVIAVLVTALATSVAAAMISRQELDIRRSENLIHGGQAYLYGLGAERWAAQILARDAEDNEIDHLGEVWAQQTQPLPIEGGQLQGRVEDLQGRFNVNSLLGENDEPNEAAVELFRRLLSQQGISPDVANALLDWLDPDQEARFPGGAEDNHYLGTEQPYRTADGPLRSISELRLLAGLEPGDYEALAPYISALPGRTAINVNTAPAPVLQALAAGLTVEDAEALIELRGDEGFADLGEFRSQPPLSGKDVPGELLSVRSEYFLAISQVAVGSTTVSLYSWLHRLDSGDVRLIARSRGTR